MKKSPKKGAITIAFDDAYLATHNHAIRYLDELGIKCTIAVPASLIGKTLEKRPVTGINRLRRCVMRGHEVASHTLTHPNLRTLSRESKKRAFLEINESKRRLEKLLNCKINSFVFPYIKKNISRPLFSKAKSLYKSVRVTSGKPCFGSMPPKDPYGLIGFAVTKKHSVKYLNNLVNYALKNNLWLIEVFHLVGEKNTLSAHRPKPYRYFMHIDDFKKHIDYILSKDIAILTQKDAVKKPPSEPPRFGRRLKRLGLCATKT